MHCSGINNESGNIRTYEIAAHACVTLNLQEKSNDKIFPTDSGVYCETIEEIVTHWYDIKARSNHYRDMASSRYDFFWEHYNPKQVYGDLYDWILQI